MDPHLSTFGWALATLAVAYGVGCRCVDAIAPGWASRAERAVYAAGLGLAGLALLMLGAAAAGLLLPAAVLGLLVLLGIVSVAPLVEGLRELAAWRPRRADPLVAGLLLAAALLALLNLSKPLSPPTHTDSLTYHLTVPKLYLERGGFFFFPHLVHANWQFVVQMLNLWGLTLEGDLLAQLVNHGVAVLSAAAAGVVTARHAGPRAGAVAVLLVIGLRASKDLLGTATDMFGLTLYTLLLVGAVMAWWEAPGDRRKGALVGVCAGCCAAAKYLGLVPATVLLAACAVRALSGSRRGVRERIATLALPGALAAAVAGPFYLKNWALSGNPVYPFAAGLFGTRDWNAAAQQNLWTLLANFGQPSRGLTGWLRMPGMAVGDRSALGFWLLPLVALLRPWDRRWALPWACFAALQAVLTLAGIQSIRYALPAWGFWTLALMLCARPRDPRWAIPLGLFAVLAVLWWTGSQQSRFLMPARAVLAVPAAAGIAASLERLPPGRPRRAAGLALAGLLIGDACAQNAIPAVRRWRVACRPDAGAAWLREEIETHRAVEFINADLPPSARVLFFNDARTYHAKRAAFTSDPSLQAVLQWDASSPPEFIAGQLRRFGVTHVLVNCRDGFRWDGGAMERLLDRQGMVLFHGRGVYVWRLDEAGAAPRRRNVFQGPAPARVEVSSLRPGSAAPPEVLADGDCCGPLAGRPVESDRWVSAEPPRPGGAEWAAVHLPAPAAVSEFRVYAVPKRAPLPASFTVQLRRGSDWVDVPGARVEGNGEASEWFFPLREPVRSDAFRVRVTATTGGPVMLREFEAWGE